MIMKTQIFREVHENLKSSWDIQPTSWLDKKEDINNIITQNKFAIRNKLMSDANSYNTWKEKALKKFINSYIVKLSVNQDWEFLSKLYYYLNLYDNLLDHSWSEKLDDILDNENSHTKAEILYELLFCNTILPDCINQKDFNKKMESFLSRLEKSISSIKKEESPIYISPVNPVTLWDYMEDIQTHSITWSKIIEKWIIKNIFYKFYFWQKIDLNEKNEFSFWVLIENDKISRDDFLVKLSEELKLQKISDKEFIYNFDSNFDYTIYVQENFYLNQNYSSLEEYKKMEEDREFSERKKLWFEVKIYAESKKDLNPEEDLANICHSFPIIMSSFLQNIYSLYEENKENIEIFPDKKQVFDLYKYLNFIEYSEDSKIEYYWFDSENDDENNDNSIVIEDLRLTDLILEEDLKIELERIIKLYKHREFFLKNGGSLVNWLLLSWEPGWWKTTIAKILANESDAWFFHIEWNIESKWVWGSANKLSDKIAEWKKFIDKNNKPAIIFIDEAEALFPKRLEMNYKEWMMSVLLQNMDWIDSKYNWMITFIFATNRKDILDSALLSRIDKNLDIPMPSKENLEKILDLHIWKKMKIIKDKMYENSDIDIKKIAQRILWKSGRFVKKIVQNAHNFWLEKYLDNPKFTMNTSIFLESIKYTETEEESKKMWFKI